MTLYSRARFAGALFASSAIVAAASLAHANGQGTPIEPVPAPAPTVLEPAGPAPAVQAPAPRRQSSWGGFYVGGHLGYAWSAENDDEIFNFDTDLDGVYNDSVLTAAGANAFSPGFCGGAATSTANADCDEDSGGFDGGLRIGYDWDLNGFVVGLVGEVSMADVTDSVSGFSTTPASYTFTRELNYLAAARLRAGFAFDSFLIYGTGGYAYGDIDRSFTTTNGANSFTAVDSNGAHGWQLGGGAEMLLGDNLSLGLEYMYTSLKDNEYFIAVGPGTAPATNPFLIDNPAGTNIQRSDDRFEIHSVRATIAYRFGE